MSSNGGGGTGSVPDTGKAFDTLSGVNPAMALDIQHSAMKGFKKRVDELLRELDDSEAAPAKVGRDRLSRAQLGSAEFKEAQFLYDSYAVVHDELEKLSKALGAQIEGMGLAVQASRVGYENLDADIKARMRAVNAEAEKYYVVERDPYVERPVPTADESGPTGEEGTY
ncbi:hypothetical protein BU52_30890 [Streptomyces toyocaensis]|uniref:Uncharacterized protein n=1 Tax=Streptomyces toyocaensis TaxID=55952 RepID=A0A081XIJ6_STRTO|nr:hypothetical protein [Streptomyces toyocaensis]KES03369.1 hypothetical protein BU52_30890 [Streptomyces toyocaensis]